MSKFEELCSAYKISLDDCWAYRDEGLNFAGVLIAKYLKYLEIPQRDWRFVPFDDDPEPNRTYNCLDAMRLHNDAFWHLGIQITIYSAPHECPQQRLLIRFRFKKAGNQRFLVKIAENDPGHTIAMDNADNFKVFFDFLQFQILRHFEDRLRNFPEQSESLGEIGFIQNC